MPTLDLTQGELKLVLKALATHDAKLTEDFEEAQFWVNRLERGDEPSAYEAQKRYVAKIEAEEAAVEELVAKFKGMN